MDSSQTEFVVENVEITYALNCCYYALLAFLLYDAALLFDDEVKYFLQPPKNLLSYLYFVTRYISALDMILALIYNTSDATLKICYIYYLTSLIDPILILCIDYILLLRVRALYSKDKAITTILAIAFGIEVICGIGMALQTTIESQPQPLNFAPGITYCVYNTQGLTEGLVSWCIPLVYGILLMVFAVYKSAKILKEDPGLTTTKMIKIIVRDQVVYFMALILISVGAIVSNYIPLSLPVVVVEGSIGRSAILSSVGARLLINMKEAGAKGENEGMGSSASRATVSGIDFAEHPAQTSAVSCGEDLEGDGQLELNEA